MSAAIEDFKLALRDAGIKPPAEIVADGKIHRCDTVMENGKGDASYLLHLDGIAAGGFQNFQDGNGWQKWRMPSNKRGQESDRKSAKIDAVIQRKQLDENENRKREAAEKAKSLFDVASLGDHPYLRKKQIEANGSRVYRSSLIVPIQNAAGDICSLQFISEEGDKKFLAGGVTKGCFHIISGSLDTVCVAEGFATGATIHQATGFTVIVAFSAENLLAITKTARSKFAATKIVICGDDDFQKPKNTGKEKAIEAAQSIGAYLAFPAFSEPRQPNHTDFNDLQIVMGPQSVKDQIANAALASLQSQGLSDDEQSFRFGKGRFCLNEKGVFYIETKDDGNEVAHWISSPVHVVAKTRNKSSDAWGRLIRWTDDDGIAHQRTISAESLQGDGALVRGDLARGGVRITTVKSHRDKLLDYIQNWTGERRARCVEKTGWHQGIYVTGEKSMGTSDEEIIFQSPYRADFAVSQKGTVEDWKMTVALPSIGNSRLIFAISLAFAGPLLGLTGGESGGFHFRGASSTGKTTGLKVSASVWGEPARYMRSWRATANGLEGLAAMHNDGVLLLDELSQLDPKQAGEAAYLLANGQGKTRSDKSGQARQSAEWRIIFLSSGEESLSSLMLSAGKRSNTGQEIRLLEIPADSGWGFGLFEEFSAFGSPAEMANRLQESAAKNFGTVGQKWLEILVRDREEITPCIQKAISEFCDEVVPKGAEGQVRRAARRFALVAIAGELASKHGLTGWPEGGAIQAAKSCFRAWLDSFGGVGNSEERKILSQVRKFFQEYGQSRFESLDDSSERYKPSVRAGYIRLKENRRQFLVFKEVFRDTLCAGVDTKAALNLLVTRAWIIPGGDGRADQKLNLPNSDNGSRVYVFDASKVLEGED